MQKFHVSSAERHLRWSKALKPVLTIDSGETVTFDLLDGGHNQIKEDSTMDDFNKFDFALADPAMGPVYVNGAEPGDVLKIEILELEPASYGWTGIFPGFGLLAHEFKEPALKIWKLDGPYAVFKEGIHIPTRPFLGVVGVAPAAAGEFSTIPPYDTGGNIDCKHTTAGSTLYLPVKAPGALFSCGDGHAAQGDGELCGTAIETPMKAKLRLSVEKGKSWLLSPHILHKHDDTGDINGQGEYTVLGIGPDMLTATKQAAHDMIEWLVATKSLTKVEAYMLLSVAGDLRLAEVVDMPNFAISCSIPLSIFVGEQYKQTH